MAENQSEDRPLGYGEMNKELDAIAGKTDPESNERRAELCDELMTLDMGMGGDRRAMGRAASGSKRSADAEPRSEAAISDESPALGGLTIVGAPMGPDDSSGQPPQTPSEPSIDETNSGGFAIIGFHAPESDASRRERRIAGFFLGNLEWISGKAQDGGDCYIVFNVLDDQGGAEGDQPPKPDDARPNRFVQFAVSSKGFYMDLPNSILTAAEAEVILHGRPQFFFASTREKSDDPHAWLNQFNPLRREYVNGEERLAAEDMAFVLFDVWKLPVSVPLEVKAGRW